MNRNGGQQQEPTEVIQPSGNASLDTVGIPSLEQGEDVKKLKAWVDSEKRELESRLEALLIH